MSLIDALNKGRCSKCSCWLAGALKVFGMPLVVTNGVATLVFCSSGCRSAWFERWGAK